jgi:prepilin-type processing-associated H-X9-DG protein
MGGPVFWSQEKLEKLAHGSVFNMLFVDGHTASIKTNILFGDNPEYLRRWNNDNLP